jgi:hypothetical protein
MTRLRVHRFPARRLRLTSGFGIAAALLVGACNQSTPIPTPSVSPASTANAPDASAERSAVASSPGASVSTIPAGQTDTDWGRIWDSLPAAFPVYPGATPAEEVQTGPVSATFAIEGREARSVASWMQSELERAAYRTEALNGPLEDGSFVLDSGGTEGCRIEVAVAPLGGLTIMTVRYGAACPSP